MTEIDQSARYSVTLHRAVTVAPFKPLKRGEQLMSGRMVARIIEQEGEDVLDARRI